ncbi:2-oxo acid dehydrogenase subunit E2 [bacterium]|nr:2-oxo acid dehydrogenase subunit E2 [bacterium]MBU4510552.1 2-oxo acid dehydrogenase subunit E2 [bacterium]
MAEVIKMPKLGLSMQKGTIVKWLFKEGERVKKGEPLLEIETEKIVNEVESPISGTLLKIYVHEGETVPILTPLGVIGKIGEKIDIDKEKDEVEEKEKSKNKNISDTKEDNESSKSEIILIGEIKASPVAIKYAKKANIEIGKIKGTGPGARILKKDVKRYLRENNMPILKEEDYGNEKISPCADCLSKEMGINIDKVEGSAPGGRIIKRDIERYIKLNDFKKENVLEQHKDKSGKDIGKRIPYTGMRKIIGDRLSQSKFTAPHIYFTISADMSKIQKLTDSFKKTSTSNISINDFIVFAVAKVLSEQPKINCSLIGDEIIYHKEINIGIAVALEEGLIVPVVRSTDKKSLLVLSKEIRNLVKLSREGKLMPDDYKGGTFTVSNLGMYGIEQFTSIINPPEAAILAVGAVKKLPIVIEEKNKDKMGIRPIAKFTLSVDHRLIDGVIAAKFLKQLKYYLEFPEVFIFKEDIHSLKKK